MSEKFTPGPWTITHDPDGGSDDYCIGVVGGKFDQVAVCSKRDAQIIAAAPDMYAALKSARRFIENGIEFGAIRMPDAPAPALDTLPTIIAALAKAAP